KQVSQQWADNSSLWCSLCSFLKTAIGQLHGCFQPSFHIQQHPLGVCMFLKCLKQQIMINVVKEAFDVKINNPCPVLASLIALCYCLMCAFLRPIPVTVRMENHFHTGFQQVFNHLLGYPVQYRGYAQTTLAASVLWNRCGLHCLWKIAARCHPVPQPVQLVP